MSPTDWDIEKTLWAEGRLVAGVDEAGRGPLAGPVVAAAVVFPLGCELSGLDDSKKLTAKRREEFLVAIQKRALSVCWAITHKDVIDRCGIARATYDSMVQALTGLSCRPDFVLIDGPRLPSGLTIPARGIVDGDAKSCSIAAASIIAKVVRDRLMLRIHERYPQYGFDHHKGYATEAHLAALAQHGPCPCHRRSFAPVREIKLDFGEE